MDSEHIGAAAQAGRRRLAFKLLLGLILVLWAAVSIPLALGQRTLFFRDVFATHVPFKAFGAQQLRVGEIPATNPTWALGQPFRGNPNTLAFYPGNLLYRVLPFWIAFNLHYALHWLLALSMMFLLARELQLGRNAALLSGLVYAGSGWLLSALTFYNITTVAAWWPLAMLGALRGTRRGLALGGMGCGLALLGGEPVTAAVGLLPMLVLVIARHGVLPGLLRVAAVGVVGLLVALPQVVATARVLPDSVRGVEGVGGAGALFSLDPRRYLELLWPLPEGWIVGPSVKGQGPSYVLSLHAGVVALALAVSVAARRRLWTWLGLAGLLLAWLASYAGELLQTLSLGLFRYPEKLLFWTALVLPLLAGAGLEQARQSPRALRRSAQAMLLCGVLLLPVAVWLGRQPGNGGVLQAALTATALLLILLLACWRSRWEGRELALLLLALVAMLPLHSLLVTDAAQPYRRLPQWLSSVPEQAQVVPSTYHSPFRHPPPRFDLSDVERPLSAIARAGAELLEPAPGVAHGLSYPLGADLEGMHTPAYGRLLRRLPTLGWPARSSWLRTLGVDAMVISPSAFRRGFPQPWDRWLPGLPVKEEASILGAPIRLLAVEQGASTLRWPRRVLVQEDEEEVFQAVERRGDPLEFAALSQWDPASGDPAHDAQGQVRLLEQSPDRLRFHSQGGGGLAVVLRAHHRLWQGASEDQVLDLVPVDGVLMGVWVPAGEREVDLWISSRPEGLASGVAILVALLCGSVLLVGRRPRRPVR